MKPIFPFYSIGHFICEPDNPTGFEITRFEEMPEPDIEDPHKHTFYEILWVSRGETVQIIDEVAYELGPGSLFFISPGQLHQFDQWHNLEGGTLMFSESFFLLDNADRSKLFELSFLDNLYSNPQLIPGTEEFDEIISLMDWMYREKYRKATASDILQSQLHLLLLLIQRSINRETDGALSRSSLIRFKTFKDLIFNNLRKSWSVRDYAEEMSITSNHLNQISREISGKTATEVIRDYTIREAKQYLAYSELTIQEVSDELGYGDPSYFSRLFRKSTGKSPQEYRNLRIVPKK